MGGLAAYEPGTETGRWSGDWRGSFDEWISNAARSLAERWAAGDRDLYNQVGRYQGFGMPSQADYGSAAMPEMEWLDSLAQRYRQNYDQGIPDYGLPGGAGGDPTRIRAALQEAWTSGSGALFDWISTQRRPMENTGTMSRQSLDFFIRMLENASPSGDPWVTSQFGTPPGSRATYGMDPNDPASLQAGSQAWLSGENALDRLNDAAERASREAVASIYANAQIRSSEIDAASRIQSAQIDAAARVQSVQMQVEGSWRIAVLEDATRRYIADGDWGVQRELAQLREQGMMDRLLLELESRDEDRAQRALEARQLHHREMIGLALEVAKYDAALAAEPRNWLAYASWLGNRGAVVNGLSLAMAADMVPELDAEVAAANTGAPAGAVAVATAEEVRAEGGADPAAGARDVTPPAETAGAPPQAPPQGQPDYTVAGVDLGAVTDYGALANYLMGRDPNAANEQPTPEQLAQAQAQYDTSQRVPGFAAWEGPTTNALGMTVNPQGQSVDYRNFRELLPTQQEMKVGEVTSVRGKFGAQDFFKEMERSRPKGQTSAVAGRG